MTDAVLENRFNTLESLIKSLFSSLDEKIESLAIMTNNRFDEMDDRFDKMDGRFDRLENIVVAGHERRIEILEDNQRKFATKLNLDLRT